MSDPAQLIVIRHGRAHCNDAGTIAGPGCTGLTPTGRDQAAATARRLAAGGVTALYASTTLRAAQTAQIIAKPLNLPVTYEQDLRVPDPGEADGHPWEQARARWPCDPDSFTRPVAPGAETWLTYLSRAAATLDRILETHPGGTVAIVGHSETLTTMLHALLNTPTLGRLKLAFDHCALTTWHATAEWPGIKSPHPRWTLTRHNDSNHLAGGGP